MHAKCSLSFVGEKHTETAAQSVHTLTHSFTVMPVISTDDSLFPCLYICFQEEKRTFGSLIQQSIFIAKNLITDVLHSGTMGKSNLQHFFCDKFFPFCDKNSLLFVCS
jgi:hypothetical protein